MLKRVFPRLSSAAAPGGGSGSGVSSVTGFAFVPTQVACLEVWEHFKRFGMSECGDAVTVRLQAPQDTVALLNNTVLMRNHLELFLVPPQGGVVNAEKGWQIGSFRNTRNASRRLIVETLLSHGWSLDQQTLAVSERDMIITAMTFTRRQQQQQQQSSQPSSSTPSTDPK